MRGPFTASIAFFAVKAVNVWLYVAGRLAPTSLKSRSPAKEEPAKEEPAMKVPASVKRWYHTASVRVPTDSGCSHRPLLLLFTQHPVVKP